jgi:hypothetical protein
MIVPSLLLASAVVSFVPAPALTLAQQTADSAGVRVMLSRPGDVPADSWRLAAAPDVEIGVETGQPAYQLDRVSSGAILSNGTIVVANSGSRELRFFDAAGAHVRSVGREGQGPGEFQSLTLVGAFAGDSLLAWDPGQRRLSVFDASGRLARTVAVPSAFGPTPPLTAGVLRDGRLVAQRREIPILSASPPPAGIVRPNATILTLSADGASTATVGTFPDSEVSIYQGVSFGVIFGRSIELWGRGDRIAIGNTDAYRIRVYSADGRLLHIVRQTREPRRFTEEEYQAARPATFPSSPVGARMKGAVDQMPRPDALPAFADVRMDGEGNLWVQEFALESDPRTSWQVFSGEGRLIGRLSAPSSHTLLDATAAHALFRVTDELGVHRLRVYRLAK